MDSVACVHVYVVCVYKMLSSASTDCPILDVSFFDHLANHSLWTDITEVSTRPMSVEVHSPCPALLHGQSQA